MTLPELATKYPHGPGAAVLRVYANRGTLPAEKIGRDWTMSEDDYRTWLEARGTLLTDPSPTSSSTETDTV